MSGNREHEHNHEHCEHEHKHGHFHEHEHEHHEHAHHEHSHGHGHDHGCACCGGEGEHENKGVMIGRIIGAAILLIAGFFFPEDSVGRLLLCAASALCVGYDVLWGALRNLVHGEMLDELFLMTLAGVGAFILGEYTEGALVFLLFQTGEFLQDLAVDRSRGAIEALMDIRPDGAVVLRDGTEQKVKPEEVSVGEILVVRPGERIALDGTVEEGESFLDTVALTGESVPRSVHPGEEVLSGCVNLRGLLKIRTLRPATESAAARILKLVEEAREHKSKADKFITRFARIYTPAVIACAAVVFVVGSLVTGNWGEWAGRALTFLVISCPCALVISVPLSYFSGIGRASRKGILMKGADALEALSRAGIVAFDKTGTITRGVFEVTAIKPETMTEKELLRLAAAAERYSTHPIAGAIRKAAGESEDAEVGDAREISGHGVEATVNGHRVAAGNARHMEAAGVAFREETHAGTVVYVAVDGKYEGCLVIVDIPKPGADEAVRELKELKIRKTVMLTGDRHAVAAEIGRQAGVDEVRAELLPEDKVTCARELMSGKADAGETFVFVGDGINDAPVLTAADVGVAMGGMGSDAAVEAADVVLIDDDPKKLAVAVRLARRTQSIVKQNIVFSIAVKLIVMILGAMGAVPLWLAVFSDVGVCLLAILNAVR